MLTQMAAPPTALSGVGIGLRRWRAGGSRAMGRCRRSTGAAALPPVGLGLTSREEPLVKNSLEARGWLAGLVFYYILRLLSEMARAFLLSSVAAADHQTLD